MELEEQRAKNRAYQKAWYERQKNNGIVYKLWVGPHFYIGSTTSSLNKRLHRHLAARFKRLGRVTDAILKYRNSVSIYELERVDDPTKLKEREQYWIDKEKPDLNVSRVIGLPKPEPKGCYKGGVTFEGIWYPTRLALWQARGLVPYNTFRSRLRRSRNIKKALGVIQIKL